jgi:hypothetical protein
MPRVPLFPSVVVRLPFKTTTTEDGRSKRTLRLPVDLKPRPAANLAAGPAQVPPQRAALATAVPGGVALPWADKPLPKGPLPPIPVDPCYGTYVTEFRYRAGDHAGNRRQFAEAIEWNASQNAGLKPRFEERDGELHLSSDLASLVYLRGLAGRETAAFAACKQQLLTDAVQYFNDKIFEARPGVPAWAEDEAPLSIARRLLSASAGAGGGLVLGEDHQEIGPKKFLVENMGALGVKVLFLEHLLWEKHQEDIDRYQGEAGSAMPPRLRSDVQQLNDRLMLHVGGSAMRAAHAAEKARYNYMAILEAAKKFGVEVRTIDCEASYALGARSVYSRKTDDIERQQAMNYLAAKKVDEYRRNGGGPWLMLVGNVHTNTLLGVPGVAELTASLSLRLHDSYPGRQYSELHQALKSDVTLAMPLGQ